MKFERLSNFKKYDHLEVVGRCAYRVTYAKDLYNAIPSPISNYLSEQNYYQELKSKATHRFVLPTQKNFDTSFRKLDHKRVCPTYQELKPSLKILRQTHASVFLQPPGFNETRYNPTTSPGYCMKACGVSDKEQAMKSDLLPYLLSRFATPVAQTSPKNEAMSLEDIYSFKIRTFFAMDVHHCVNQWFLYTAQEEAYKRLCLTGKVYGVYGFSKEYGGFNKLARDLTDVNLAYLSSLDVSGWDRQIPLLPYIYYERNRVLCSLDNKLKVKFKELFKALDDGTMGVDWLLSNYYIYQSPSNPREQVTERAWNSTIHSCFTIVIDADGYMVLMHMGNRSGNPCTTSDNTLMHTLVEIHGQRHLQNLIRIGSDADSYQFPYFDDLKPHPQATVKLFGDDNVKKYPQELVIGNDSKFMRRHYSRFGLTIKESAFKESYTTDPQQLLGYEFLGSTFSYNKEYQKWYPMPREGKIASSILYSQKQDIELYTQRIIGLANVSYGNKFLFSILLDIIKHLICSYPDLTHTTTSQLSDMLKTASKPEVTIFGFE